MFSIRTLASFGSGSTLNENDGNSRASNSSRLNNFRGTSTSPCVAARSTSFWFSGLLKTTTNNNKEMKSPMPNNATTVVSTCVHALFASGVVGGSGLDSTAPPPRISLSSSPQSCTRSCSPSFRHRSIARSTRSENRPLPNFCADGIGSGSPRNFAWRRLSAFTGCGGSYGRFPPATIRHITAPTPYRSVQAPNRPSLTCSMAA